MKLHSSKIVFHKTQSRANIHRQEKGDKRSGNPIKKYSPYKRVFAVARDSAIERDKAGTV